jgi:nucleoside-diphosphate-sugar epimerase
MTVLVTGAAGFLGRQLTELLLARDEQVRVLVRPEDRLGSLPATGADIRRADINDDAAVAMALRGVDQVLHCAARTGPWGPAAAYEQTNVRALENLVRAALTAGVSRLVHVSSVTVHGNDVGGAADEDAPFRSEPNPYSRSKVAGEQLLARMISKDGAPVTIVRPGWIYGPGDTASFARIARMVETGRMITVGSGENHLPLIYVRDAAQGVLLAGLAAAAEGKRYLLVNDEPVTQRAFLAAIAAELGARAPRYRIPYRLALGLGATAEGLWRLTGRTEPPPLMRYGLQLLGGENRFSIGRARRDLGFEPQVGMAEGIRLSTEWYRARQAVPDGVGARA